MIKNKNTKIKANIQAIRPFSRHDLVLFKFGEWKYTRESDLIWFDCKNCTNKPCVFNLHLLSLKKRNNFSEFNSN